LFSGFFGFVNTGEARSSHYCAKKTTTPANSTKRNFSKNARIPDFLGPVDPACNCASIGTYLSIIRRFLATINIFQPTIVLMLVPHKNGLEPIKKIDPLNGVIFTLPTKKMLNFS
jgi:hypothetical protein